MGDVVVGVDASDTARRAAEVAAELAAQTGRNLHLVRAIPRQAAEVVEVGREQFAIDAVTMAEHELAELVRTLRLPRVSVAVRVGDPASVICSEADRVMADIVVVGNRRVRSLTRVLGSVAGGVLRSAPCHVLVADTVD